MAETAISDRQARFILTIDRVAFDIAQHWLAYVNFVFGVFVLAPFAAPAFMAVGWTAPAEAIYWFYSSLCHQLPERSFFLFGHKASYSLAEISRAYSYSDILTLRQFIGNEAMGWKMAWSDRMVALYGSFWVGGLLFALFWRRLPRLSWVTWLLLGILPMGVDGFSHVINDAVAGISGTGFRDTNVWLRVITGNMFPAQFYAGDALGSFNNLARLITGTLTGLTTVWFLYPFADRAMTDVVHISQERLGSPRAVALRRSHQPVHMDANE